MSFIILDKILSIQTASDPFLPPFLPHSILIKPMLIFPDCVLSFYYHFDLFLIFFSVFATFLEFLMPSFISFNLCAALSDLLLYLYTKVFISFIVLLISRSSVGFFSQICYATLYSLHTLLIILSGFIKSKYSYFIVYG